MAAMRCGHPVLWCLTLHMKYKLAVMPNACTKVIPQVHAVWFVRGALSMRVGAVMSRQRMKPKPGTGVCGQTLTLSIRTTGESENDQRVGDTMDLRLIASLPDWLGYCLQ